MTGQKTFRKIREIISSSIGCIRRKRGRDSGDRETKNPIFKFVLESNFARVAFWGPNKVVQFYAMYAYYILAFIKIYDFMSPRSKLFVLNLFQLFVDESISNGRSHKKMHRIVA
jgi:hypothetical protein